MRFEMKEMLRCESASRLPPFFPGVPPTQIAVPRPGRTMRLLRTITFLPQLASSQM